MGCAQQSPFPGGLRPGAPLSVNGRPLSSTVSITHSEWPGQTWKRGTQDPAPRGGRSVCSDLHGLGGTESRKHWPDSSSQSCWVQGPQGNCSIQLQAAAATAVVGSWIPEPSASLAMSCRHPPGDPGSNSWSPSGKVSVVPSSRSATWPTLLGRPASSKPFARSRATLGIRMKPQPVSESFIRTLLSILLEGSWMPWRLSSVILKCREPTGRRAGPSAGPWHGCPLVFLSLGGLYLASPMAGGTGWMSQNALRTT